MSDNCISLSAPCLGGREWDYLKECLDSGWVSSAGKFVERFEHQVGQRIGRRHAVATSSGTAALHVALQVAGVEENDEVVVSTVTFIAPVNAIRYLRAHPVFIDAEPNYWQIDTARVHEFLTAECCWDGRTLRNRATKRRVRALLPVHVLGHPIDLDPLLEMADRYNLAVVEDATECLGALYKGRSVGGDGLLACFSFNGNKIITTGGGGMLVTDNPELARQARYLTTQAKDHPSEYIHGAVGYNYRLTNIQAALGCAQMERLTEHIKAKRRIAETYRVHLSDVPGLTCMREAPWAFSIDWMFTVLVDQNRYGRSSRGLMAHLARRQIETRPLWQPAHESPSQAGAGVTFPSPVSQRLYAEALSLPCSVGLTAEEQERVIHELKYQGD